jgi:hypothetical protein
MVYQMQEGCLTLDRTWHDQSVNVLVPEGVATKGVNLVVARDTMPLGMTLTDYVAQQKITFEKELTEYRLMADSPGAVDQRSAHFLEFSWKNDGKLLQQMMVVILDNRHIVNLTGTIPGQGDAEARSFLLAAMISFKFDALRGTV